MWTLTEGASKFALDIKPHSQGFSRHSQSQRQDNGKNSRHNEFRVLAYETNHKEKKWTIFSLLRGTKEINHTYIDEPLQFLF